VSEKSKGNQFVNKIIEKFLAPNGYACEKAGQAVTWIPVRDRFNKTVYVDGKPQLRPITRREDFWHCIDIIANHAEQMPIYIQATIGDDRRRQQRQRKIDSLKHWNLDYQCLQVWQRDNSGNKQGVFIYQLQNDRDSKTGWKWAKFRFDFKTDNLNSVIYGTAIARELPSMEKSK